MDIRLADAPPTTAEREAVDGVLGTPLSAWEGGARGADGHFARGGHSARSQRHLLLPVLHEVQSRVGWISPGALSYVCRRRSEEHTSELQSRSDLVCRLLLEKKK